MQLQGGALHRRQACVWEPSLIRHSVLCLSRTSTATGWPTACHVLQVGKEHASQVSKAPSKAEALKLREAGYAALQALYRRQAGHIDSLKTVAMALRRLPVVDVSYPMVRWRPCV